MSAETFDSFPQPYAAASLRAELSAEGARMTGDELREIRVERLGWTQSEMAAALDLSKSTYWRREQLEEIPAEMELAVSALLMHRIIERLGEESDAEGDEDDEDPESMAGEGIGEEG